MTEPIMKTMSGSAVRMPAGKLAWMNAMADGCTVSMFISSRTAILTSRAALAASSAVISIKPTTELNAERTERVAKEAEAKEVTVKDATVKDATVKEGVRGPDAAGGKFSPRSGF